MKKLLCIIAFLMPFVAGAKDYTVKMNIRNLPVGQQPILIKIFNGNTYLVDSIPSRTGDAWLYRVPENTREGVLRLMFNVSEYERYLGRQPKMIDLLFMHEDIEFSIDFNDFNNSLDIIRSEENRKYYHYLKREFLFTQKLKIFEEVLGLYPEKDDFYNLASRYYTQQQVKRDEWIDSVFRAEPHSLAAKIIRGMKMPFLDIRMSQQERDSLFKEDFLGTISFSDTVLLYTPVYTDKIYRFINLYISQYATPRDNENNARKAVDKIFPHIMENEIVRDYMVRFMIAQFEGMGMENVLAYISELYSSQCGSSNEVVAERLEKYQKMGVGNKVPDFVTYDTEGNAVSLYSSINPYTLVIFWHTDCNHCQEMFRELEVLMQSDFFRSNHVHVIGISIDEDKERWLNFSKGKDFGWVNTHTEGSFDSPVASDFNIFATPTMFLLNDKYEIISKPILIQELKEDIEKLN